MGQGARLLKIVLGILLAVSIALNALFGYGLHNAHKVNALQAEAIKVDQLYWAEIQTKPVFVWKHPPTGNLFVGVPYREKPILFKGVCMPEQRL